MADIGIRGCGKSESEAFEMGAEALTAVVTTIGKVKKIEAVGVSCRAKDLDFLFFEWINSIIYEMDVRRMLFRTFDICINRGNGLTLDAVMLGEHLNIRRHQPAVIIKGATMTELRVYKSGRIWTAQCVVDV